MPKKPLSEDAMRMRMADLCARTEQCASDLRTKMKHGGMTDEQTERILQSLRDNHFLDEARFARAYARDKARFAGWGVMKIRQGLAAKRIPSNLISEGIASIDRQEYIDSLKRAATSKARTLNLTQREDVLKLYRHLATKGYESTLISKIVTFLRKDQ